MVSRIMYDGEARPVSERLERALTPGLCRKRGVFETLRLEDSVLFDVPEHFKRMAAGLTALGIDPWIVIAIRRDSVAVGATTGPGLFRLRALVWQGRKRLHRAVVIIPYVPTAKKSFRVGRSVVLAAQLISSYLKPLAYSFYLKAYERALAAGYDEALLTGPGGILVECSRSNLFLVRGGTLLTPSLADGALAGITRARVLRLARSRGIPVRETRLTLTDLNTCQEVFITNSLLGIVSVSEIAGCRVSAAGEITGALQRA